MPLGKRLPAELLCGRLAASAPANVCGFVSVKIGSLPREIVQLDSGAGACRCAGALNLACIRGGVRL